MPYLALLPRLLAALPLSVALLAIGSSGGGAHSPSIVSARGSGVAAASQQQLADVPYNGTFTFTRLRYGAVGSVSGRRFRGYGNSSAWNHDYPGADRNLQSLLAEYTFMRANTHGSNVLDLEDPTIFQHPILYMSEPGYWTATDEGILNLRAYLLKGGFLMFDDFEAEQWDNMAEQVRRALPEYDWVELDDTHPIFHSFYLFNDIYVPHPLVRVRPSYRAIFEDNDPTQRIMVLANHNSDLGEYWEWAARGQFGMAPTNDAYRLGINYLIYGVTH